MILFFRKDETDGRIHYPVWYEKADEYEREEVIEVEMPERPKRQKGIDYKASYNYINEIGYWKEVETGIGSTEEDIAPDEGEAVE